MVLNGNMKLKKYKKVIYFLLKILYNISERRRYEIKLLSQETQNFKKSNTEAVC